MAEKDFPPDNKKTTIDTDKVKMMFSLLGEIVVMFLSFVNIFKKNEN